MASFANIKFEGTLFSKSMHYFCRPHAMSITKTAVSFSPIILLAKSS